LKEFAWDLIDLYGKDVTSGFLHMTSDEPPEPAADPLPASGPYVDLQVLEAIRAKDGVSSFNVAKLLNLIAELNDNYARKNTYASHALMRAILDHVPPILGCASFAAIANNYPWGPTDKRYIKKLVDFRDRADDALHRQIRNKGDLLDVDDLVHLRVPVGQLLQECVDHL
jgi:hypothetical protein